MNKSSTIEWSAEQLTAIETLNKNILISASAGAGKTTVLIGRLMHLIVDEHYDLSEVLAMTFSEAAAAEMKKRLSKELSDKLAQDPQDAFIKSQLEASANASISTIHGFCLDVIKEYYYVCGLDSQRLNNPIDDATCNLLKQEALTQTIKAFYGHPVYEPLLDAFNQRIEGIGKLDEAIKNLANLANSKADPKGYLNYCRQEFKTIANLKQLNADVLESFYLFFQIKTNSYLLNLQEEFASLKNPPLDKIEYTKNALKALKRHDYAEYRDYLLAAFHIGGTGITFSTASGKLEKELIKYLYPESDYVKHHNNCVKKVDLLITMAETYLDNYAALKVEANGIDFDDMEHYAVAVLTADDNYVAGLLKQRYRTIMVDEFQDTSDVQNRLVELIARDDNVFRVGDIKQSIYGFRHALPRIMRNLLNNPRPNDEIVYLSSNYRSRKTVVDFNNYLYDKLMNVEGIDALYSIHDAVKIGSKKQEVSSPPVKMHLIKNDLTDENDNKFEEIRGEYLVKMIQDCLKRGYHYRDLVILTRGNEKMYQIKKVFDQYGIPCFFSKKQGLFKSTSVNSVISFLRCLVNPDDDISFVAMISSNLYRITYEEIAKVGLKRGNHSYYALFKDDERLASFRAITANVSQMKLADIIAVIYDINDFYIDYLDAQERSNLDLLYETVGEYEKADMGITALVDILNAQEAEDQGEAMPIGVNDDVVRIMTMHASKGLQFKVVFVYSSSSFKDKESGDMATYDDTLGIGMKDLTPQRVKYESVTSLALKQKRIKSNLEEEMRLLYVATTRAQQELHIIDIIKNPEKVIVKPYNITTFYQNGGYTGWIRSAMLGCDDAIYQEEIIEDTWTNDNIETPVIPVKHYAYQGENRRITISSPSDYEDKMLLPPFKIDQDDRALHGSELHKMIEVLPDCEWDAQLITQVSGEEKITLSEDDINLLMKLNGNSLFQATREFKDIYHEYPFIYQSETGLMKGYMDYVAIGDKVIMIDFKSDHHSDAATLKKRYEGQVNAYRDALKAMYPNQEIETYLFGLVQGEMIKV